MVSWHHHRWREGRPRKEHSPSSTEPSVAPKVAASERQQNGYFVARAQGARFVNPTNATKYGRFVAFGQRWTPREQGSFPAPLYAGTAATTWNQRIRSEARKGARTQRPGHGQAPKGPAAGFPPPRSPQRGQRGREGRRGEATARQKGRATRTSRDVLVALCRARAWQRSQGCRTGFPRT